MARFGYTCGNKSISCLVYSTWLNPDEALVELDVVYGTERDRRTNLVAPVATPTRNPRMVIPPLELESQSVVVATAPESVIDAGICPRPRVLG